MHSLPSYMPLSMQMALLRVNTVTMTPVLRLFRSVLVVRQGSLNVSKAASGSLVVPVVKSVSATHRSTIGKPVYSGAY